YIYRGTSFIGMQRMNCQLQKLAAQLAPPLTPKCSRFLKLTASACVTVNFVWRFLQFGLAASGQPTIRAIRAASTTSSVIVLSCRRRAAVGCAGIGWLGTRQNRGPPGWLAL